MSEKGRPRPDMQMQARIRAAADQAALRAVTRHSSLRGPHALEVARHAVAAATPDVQAGYAAELLGTTARQRAATAALVLGAFAGQVAAYTATARRGGTTGRILLGVALGLQAATIGYAQYRKQRLIVAAGREFHRLQAVRPA